MSLGFGVVTVEDSSLKQSQERVFSGMTENDKGSLSGYRSDGMDGGEDDYSLRVEQRIRANRYKVWCSKTEG